MKRIINIDLVPNFETDDYQIIKNLNRNNKFNFSEAEIRVKKILNSYFPNKDFFFFNSGRSALTFLLENLETKGKVVTQAFSCLVVPNAIKFANFKPIYVDIDKSFNLDIDDLKRKIDKETKAIIIQNTFGLPAKIDEIIKIAKENNLLVIENLTHALGAKHKSIYYLGNFGDVSLLSFNRNKVISSIIGGALVVNNKELLIKIIDKYKSLPEFPLKELKKVVLTGKILYRAKMNYNFLTKAKLKFLRMTKLISEMISSVEKEGKKPKNYLTKFPPALFPLLENQLKKLEKFNRHRREISEIYIQAGLKNFEINENTEPIFLRFPVISEKKDWLLKKFKKENIYLGDWYNCVLAPCGNLENFAYQIGSCPKAEEVSKKIFNLPTHINVTKEDAYRILELLEKWK